MLDNPRNGFWKFSPWTRMSVWIRDASITEQRFSADYSYGTPRVGAATNFSSSSSR
jgi:hypothetical protein